MLDSDGNLVLIDLGLARKASRPSSSTLCPSEEPECSCGTPGFISPEVYHNETPTYKSDIYSVGIVLGCFFEHYLVGCDLHYLGGSLVRSSTTEVIIQKLVSFLSHRPISGSCGSSVASSYYVNDTPDVIYDAADLLQSMIQTLPENRPTSSEILLHPFFLTLDRLPSSPLPPTQDPFANTDWETYENKKRVLAYREMQWQQSMDSDEDCYYSYL
jgi:serine/threonine protein kinase